MNIKKIIGGKIAFLRKINGIKQTDFAKRIGVSQNTLSRWENGIISPNEEQLLKIANLFDVSMDYLFGRSKNEIIKPISEIANKAEYSQDDSLVQKLKELLESYEKK